MSSVADSELESFRRQWQEEVQRRRDGKSPKSQQSRPKHTRTISKDASLAAHLGGSASSGNPIHDEDIQFGTYDFDDMEAHEASRKVGSSGSDIKPESIHNRDPVSALDHYELAVVRETEGKLGESLDLYRKAFRLDDCVDQLYKKKHFPASSFKPKASERTPTSQTNKPKENLTVGSAISVLVASFADVPILGALPMISGDIPPPCFIKDLPSELLVDILDHVAHTDVATLPHLALVSKRFAYLVAAQDSVWKSLIHGPRFGLGGMHYSYSKEISGASLEASLAELILSPIDRVPRVLPITLPLNSAYPTYRHMFQHRPRIRFSGVYISTVNYTRPGASGPNAVSWNAPIHVVTYYRYLRFYRDGSCISLLTTTEPLEVVPYLQKENIGGEGVATTTLPIGVMRDARKGRWKLATPEVLLEHQIKKTEPPAPESTETTHVREEVSSPIPKPTTANTATSTNQPDSPHPNPTKTTITTSNEPEGMLTIETEGPTKTYQYTAHFELQSAGASGKNHFSARNTKLAWRGFWSHNLMTGDWAEFGLRNDRAFVWSRVRSWGDA